MRFNLRFLLLLATIGPPALAAGYWFGFPVISCRDQMSSRTQCQLTLLRNAVQLYAIDVGSLPRELQGLLTMPSTLVMPSQWQGPYLEKNELPVDPWNSEYRYELLHASQKRFRITSPGRDGKLGTRDDLIVNSDL